ncbi:MAG: hypothetical protein KIH63_001880 [Candidatus Saccharibacteria bacterium]|nr:hypothetical protein [Candidatus Saccharibacteria bacterium]
MKRLSNLNTKRLLLIVVPILLVGIYYGYTQFDTWRTGQMFASLEQDIDVLKSELEKQGMQEITKNKYCLRDGEKFGGGQLRCEVGLGMRGDKATIAGAVEKFGFERLSPTENNRVQFLHTHTNTDCFINSSNQSNVDFYCIDAVNRPIYPINE